MKKVLEHIVTSLVVEKDKVNITETIKDDIYNYEVSVAKSDYGKIIGHEGKIAQSIRKIMITIATLKNVKVVVAIK